MSFLLMVFLLLVCLLNFDPPDPDWIPSANLSAGLTGLAMALVGLHALVVSRRISWPLTRNPSLRERLLPRYERGRLVNQLVLCGAYTLVLALFGWGWAVRKFLPWGNQTLPGVELLTLAPFFVGQVLSWLFFYDADRAVHQAGQGPHEALSDQPAAAPFSGRWSYVAFQLRQKLALVFIPVALLIVHKEALRLLRLLPSNWQEWRHVPARLVLPGAVGRLLPSNWLDWPFGLNAIGLGGGGLIFVAMPWVVRLLLGLRPLPAGPLRDRLMATARRLHFRCSDILFWNTRSGMANAMVIGLLPWVRYVVFTDRLLEEFPEEEVEAVFGHEAGHVRHQHMPFYLAFLTASIFVLAGLTDLVAESFAPLRAEQFTFLTDLLPLGIASSLATLSEDLAMFPAVGILLAYILVVFGFLSRRCERQADVFGCRAVSCGNPDCTAHTAGQALPPRGLGLCPTGIRTFIQALEKVALVNGISRDRPGFFQSWQHSTIGRRVAFLQRMLIDPRVEATFQRRLALLKWGLLAVLTAALVVLAYPHFRTGDSGAQPVLGPAKPQAAEEAQPLPPPHAT